MKNDVVDVIRFVKFDGALSKGPTDNLNKIAYFDRVSNITALVLGRLLKENLDNRYWEKLGYSSFKEFIASAGFSFTWRTAYNYIELWELFCQWRVRFEEFVSIPYSKILLIKDVVDKNNLDEWLAKAKELSRDDLRAEVVEYKEYSDNDNQEYIPAPKVYLCKDCGKWVIEADIDDICLDKGLGVFIDKRCLGKLK